MIGPHLQPIEINPCPQRLTNVCTTSSLVKCTSLATSKRNSGKPQLIYHVWIWLSFLPQLALPLGSSTINQLWFSMVQLACCKTLQFAVPRDAHVCLRSLCPLEPFLGQVTSCQLKSTFTHYVNIHREQQNLCSSLDNWFGVGIVVVELRIGLKLSSNIGP